GAERRDGRPRRIRRLGSWRLCRQLGWQLGWNEAGHGLAAARDDHLVPALDLVEEGTEPIPGIEDADGIHAII
ncbi:hypothetical protein, partial [Methylobacterium sp. WL18]|uniref:hypothetical protein n=1 Tax=Methylobacterium sp. WL18 TaxID=2603897 RepID=UPI001FEDE7A8